MTIVRFRHTRLFITLAVLLAFAVSDLGASLYAHGTEVLPVAGESRLEAKTTLLLSIAKKRKGSSSKKKSRKSKKSSKKRSSSRTTRRYTLRGNPEVTRRVATELIATQLPDLAELVGIEPIVPEAAVAEKLEKTVATESELADPTANVPTTHVAATAGGDYSDAELSDAEDPDAITEEDEAMLEEEDEDLTITEFYKEFTEYMATLNGEGDIYVTDNGIDKMVAMEALVDWLGTRYLFGGTSKSGIDCSAFTRTVYRSIGFGLPRTAAMQWEVGDAVDREELQFGDLVFFNTRSAVWVSHVGMYLGNDLFAHASSRNGVTVSSLNSDYYSSHYIGGRRYDVAAALAEEAETQDAVADEASEPISEAR